MRRAAEVVAALLLLVLTAPLLALAALALCLHERGPVLYRDPREGIGGTPITLLKLRTMRVDSAERLERLLACDDAAREEWLAYYRLRRDPRVLGRAGRIIRRLSIDELPQLVNVLRGDVALVGPRPLPTYITETLPRDAVVRRRRVRPGLTGLWQVSGRSDLDIVAMLALDLEYVERRTARLDAAILARTALAVLSTRGAS